MSGILVRGLLQSTATATVHHMGWDIGKSSAGFYLFTALNFVLLFSHRWPSQQLLSSGNFMPCKGSQPAGDYKSSITFRQACGYLPSRRTSLPLGWYHVILLGDRGT